MQPQFTTVASTFDGTFVGSGIRLATDFLLETELWIARVEGLYRLAESLPMGSLRQRLLDAAQETIDQGIHAFTGDGKFPATPDAPGAALSGRQLVLVSACLMDRADNSRNANLRIAFYDAAERLETFVGRCVA